MRGREISAGGAGGGRGGGGGGEGLGSYRKGFWWWRRKVEAKEVGEWRRMPNRSDVDVEERSKPSGEEAETVQEW